LNAAKEKLEIVKERGGAAPLKTAKEPVEKHRLETYFNFALLVRSFNEGEGEENFCFCLNEILADFIFNFCGIGRLLTFIV